MNFKKPYSAARHVRPFGEDLRTRNSISIGTPFISHSPPNISRPSTDIFISDAQRSKGLYIAGNPGSGKSSLLQNLILRDIAAGYGVCVIDPSGDLISKVDSQDAIIDWIPERRLSDTIYFNTSNCVKALDLFSYHDADERRVMIDELVAIFKLDNAPKAKPLLARIISILLDANDRSGRTKYTFLDIQQFIDDSEWRAKVAAEAGTTFFNLTPKDMEAITWRLLPFTTDPVLRQIVSSTTPEINLWDAMEQGKILLIDLNDTETDYFIGSLIVAKLQQAAFRRRTIPKRVRDKNPYFLYVDEFHAIAAMSGEHFNKMLTRGRKYNVCLTFANPYPDDDEIPSSLQRKLPGVATKLLFNLDESHSRIFRTQLFPIPSLNFLKPFTAALVQQGKETVLVDTPHFLPPNHASFAESIKNLSPPRQNSSVPQDDKDDDNIQTPEPTGIPPYQSKKDHSKPSR